MANTMKILFVCLANKIRSRGAEAWFEKKFPEHEFQSAGVLPERVKIVRDEFFPGAQVLSPRLLEWADKIVFMDDETLQKAKELLGRNVINNIHKLENWGVPDCFSSWDSPSLIKLFESLELDDFFK